MPDEQKPVKKLSDKELLEAENSSLNNDQLQRKLMLIDIEARVGQAELTRHQTNQFKMKQAEQKDKFFSRGRELNNVAASHKKQQDSCSHLKGGKGLQALQVGGTDMSDAALIRHLFPWNEWKARCQRCGKTFAAPRPENFDLTTPEGKAAFDKQKAEFDWAMKAPSNNSASTGITFQHHSDDENKSAKAFINETTKNVTLR
jgi:hypothetical protein